jgi:hypothetical protein
MDDDTRNFLRNVLKVHIKINFIYFDIQKPYIKYGT